MSGLHLDNMLKGTKQSIQNLGGHQDLCLSLIVDLCQIYYNLQCISHGGKFGFQGAKSPFALPPYVKGITCYDTTHVAFLV